MKFQSQLFVLALLLTGVQLGNLQAARPKAQPHVGLYQKSGREIANMSDAEFNKLSPKQVEELVAMGISGTVSDKKNAARTFVTKKLGVGSQNFTNANSDNLVASLRAKQGKKSAPSSSKGGSGSTIGSGILTPPPATGTTGTSVAAGAIHPAAIKTKADIKYDSLKKDEQDAYNEMVKLVLAMEAVVGKIADPKDIEEKMKTLDEATRKEYETNFKRYTELSSQHSEFLNNTTEGMSLMTKMAIAGAAIGGTVAGAEVLYWMKYLPIVGQFNNTVVSGAKTMGNLIKNYTWEIGKAHPYVTAGIAVAVGGTVYLYNKIYNQAVSKDKPTNVAELSASIENAAKNKEQLVNEVKKEDAAAGKQVTELTTKLTDLKILLDAASNESEKTEIMQKMAAVKADIEALDMNNKTIYDTLHSWTLGNKWAKPIVGGAILVASAYYMGWYPSWETTKDAGKRLLSLVTLGYLAGKGGEMLNNAEKSVMKSDIIPSNAHIQQQKIEALAKIEPTNVNDIKLAQQLTTLTSEELVVKALEEELK